MNATRAILETVKTEELRNFLTASEWFISSAELKKKYNLTNIAQLFIDRKLEEGVDYIVVKRGKEPLFLDELCLLGMTSYISKRLSIISPTGMAKIAIYTAKDEFSEAKCKAVQLLSECVKTGILD